MSTSGLVKCVVWDLDNTLLRGTYLESLPGRPPADPALASLLAELGRRGIVHAIASRNPPEAAEYAAQATGCVFVAAECGWGRKSEALTRIAAGLDIAVDALAFVDDDPYERAEVGAALPGVRVLSPEDAADAAGWPEFSPAEVTEEARRRASLYQQRQRRQEAEAVFAGSHEDFLRACQTQVTIAAASPDDVPRLRELSERTSQFNSGGQALSAASLEALIGAPARDVMTVRLRDRFADDGLVGGCVIDRRQERVWTVPLLMMSCRAIGRGVIDSLLTWLANGAARYGAAAVQVPCPVTERSVPLRLALTRAGFRARPDQAAGHGRVVFRCELGAPRPALPDWVTAPGET
jgi:methoxymalonate biosynthesis protein